MMNFIIETIGHRRYKSFRHSCKYIH